MALGTNPIQGLFIPGYSQPSFPRFGGGRRCFSDVGLGGCNLGGMRPSDFSELLVSNRANYPDVDEGLEMFDE